jgi:hypothetical protein
MGLRYNVAEKFSRKIWFNLTMISKINPTSSSPISKRLQAMMKTMVWGRIKAETLEKLCKAF